MSTALTTNVDQRLLKSTKFPPEFNIKVDMNKVNTPVIKNWVADRIAHILENDDDVVPELVFNMLEESRYPKIKELQIALGGFLNEDAPKFCRALWKMCISAQESPQGVPKELLEAKKKELEEERLEQDRAREEATRRHQSEREHERNVDNMRRADRVARDDRRGPSHYGRGQYNRSPPRFNDRRRSRSPPRGPRLDKRRRSRSPPHAPRLDHHHHRRRSPSPDYRRGDDHRPTRRDSDRYTPDRSPRGNRRYRHASTSSSGRSSRGRGNRLNRGDNHGKARPSIDDHRSHSPARRHSDTSSRGASLASRVTRPGPPLAERVTTPVSPDNTLKGERGRTARSRKPDLMSGPQRGSGDNGRLSRSPKPKESSTTK